MKTSSIIMDHNHLHHSSLQEFNTYSVNTSDKVPSSQIGDSSASNPMSPQKSTSNSAYALPSLLAMESPSRYQQQLQYQQHLLQQQQTRQLQSQLQSYSFQQQQQQQQQQHGRSLNYNNSPQISHSTNPNFSFQQYLLANTTDLYLNPQNYPSLNRDYTTNNNNIPINIGELALNLPSLGSAPNIIDNNTLEQNRLDSMKATVNAAIAAAEASAAEDSGINLRRRRKRTNSYDSNSNQSNSSSSSSINSTNSTNSTTKIYPCDQCDKVFHRPYNLRSHLKSHSTEKPFACKHCGRRFTRGHDKKRHELLHDGSKRFKCGGFLSDGKTRWGCNKKFARADALGRHFRTETGWLCIKPLMNEAKEKEKIENNNSQINSTYQPINQQNQINMIAQQAVEQMRQDYGYNNQLNLNKSRNLPLTLNNLVQNNSVSSSPKNNNLMIPNSNSTSVSTSPYNSLPNDPIYNVKLEEFDPAQSVINDILKNVSEARP